MEEGPDHTEQIPSHTSIHWDVQITTVVIHVSHRPWFICGSSSGEILLEFLQARTGVLSFPLKELHCLLSPPNCCKTAELWLLALSTHRPLENTLLEV